LIVLEWMLIGVSLAQCFICVAPFVLFCVCALHGRFPLIRLYCVIPFAREFLSGQRDKGERD
jgi:hypothetical protein